MPKIVFLFLFFVSAVQAQLPETDIWLIAIDRAGDSIVCRSAENITHRKGYDNQPCFSLSGEQVFYTAMMQDDQSDIYIYSIREKRATPFCQTPESEYSPTILPDGKHVSVVMVEKDSTQRLWQYPIKGGKANLLLKNVDSVGYHNWYSKNEVVLWMLTEPASLVLYSTKNEKTTQIDTSIGRCFKTHEHLLYFTHQLNENAFQLCNYSLPGRKINSRTGITLPTQDFEFLNDVLIYADGAVLYSIRLSDQRKQQIMDLTSYGIKQISRIAVNKQGTQLAIVAE